MVALASYRSGSGLVKVFTHSNNRNLILSHVPEAIIECYNNENEHDALEYAQLAKDIESSIDWSSCVIIGPGLSTSKRAARTGRNPQTGAVVNIAARNAVTFKAGAALKESVN